MDTDQNKRITWNFSLLVSLQVIGEGFHILEKGINSESVEESGREMSGTDVGIIRVTLVI